LSTDFVVAPYTVLGHIPARCVIGMTSPLGVIATPDPAPEPASDPAAADPVSDPADPDPTLAVAADPVPDPVADPPDPPDPPDPLPAVTAEPLPVAGASPPVFLQAVENASETTKANHAARILGQMLHPVYTHRYIRCACYDFAGCERFLVGPSPFASASP
jgi:hypothetical protein